MCFGRNLSAWDTRTSRFLSATASSTVLFPATGSRQDVEGWQGKVLFDKADWLVYYRIIPNVIRERLRGRVPFPAVGWVRGLCTRS